MIVTSWIAYTSFTLLLFLLLPAGNLSGSKQTVLLALCFLVGAIPLPSGLPVAAYMRALTDDLAITTLTLLGFALARRLSLIEPIPRFQRAQALGVFALLGVLLYPLAMGLGMFDPYSLGYAPQSMIVAAGILCIVALVFGNWMLGTTLAMATLAYGLDLKNSSNYWDYLVDPFIVIYALAALLVMLFKRSRATREEVPAPV